jgi:hypothetical protein
MGDQLYQIFQDGYHRAASGSPIGAPGLPPASSYNGTTYPPSLTPINDYSAGNSHGFIQGSNGWSPYPGNDLGFPAMVSRGGFGNPLPQSLQHSTSHQQQPQPLQQQPQQLYHSSEFYGGSLDLNFPTYPALPPVGNPDSLMPDAFSSAQGLDYNPASVYPNAWPKQELQNGYPPRSVLEQEDIKTVGLAEIEASQNFYPSSSDGLTDPISPSASHPASPMSPPSVGASDSKRKHGGAAGKASASNGAGNSGRGKRKKPDDVADPVMRVQKERDRRVSNNSRERMRIRDINDALTELGRVCMSLRPMGKANAEKPQTKLGVLNMAVDIIMQLEKKVRDRNLNPSTVALHHRTSVGASSSMPTASTSNGSPFQAPFPPAHDMPPQMQR